ncbi:MAG: hypothetical protein V5804_02780 [Mucilaginibacter sp.]|uniref:hypothetical protein n=1 Tax=Mucilaginibacter sp. TaxID=1882438 RepID=UPI0034E6100C
MLTFEEFFKKKRIDLQHLQQAEPGLFAEFSKHYPLMGEKSFDYTKKYWFNSLRRLYPLAEEPKAHKVKADAISQTAVQGVAVAAAQNVNAAIERPKFKEDNLPELVEANVPEQDVSLAKEEKLIIEGTSEAELATDNPQPATEAVKPTFKPRFNSKIIKKPEAEAAPVPAKEAEPAMENPQPAIEQKPAFKPRFNMQNIKKEPVKTASETETKKPIPEPAPTENAEPATEIPQPKTEEAKPVYKPRFQMKNIPKPAAGNPPPETED